MWPFSRRPFPIPTQQPVDESERLVRCVDMSAYERHDVPRDQRGDVVAMRGRRIGSSDAPITTIELAESVGGDGTPWAGDVPASEPNEDLYPYAVRGLSSDPGTYEATYRGDAVIFDAVNRAVDMIGGATIEWGAPEVDARHAAILGWDPVALSDRLERDAERLNIETLINPDIDFVGAIREQTRDLLVKGFALSEGAVDVRRPIGRQMRVEYRAPSSVQGWVLDAHGLPVAFTQQLPYARGTRAKMSAIDLRRCVYAAGLASGGNAEGIARIRPAVVIHEAWGEWIQTGRMQRRRFGAGFPIFRRLDGAPSGADVNASIHNAATNFFASSKAYVSLPAGVVLELLQTQADTVSVGVLEYFDRLKREALGAMVFALGQGQAGSWALSDVLGQLYFKQLAGFAEELCAGWSRFGRTVLDATSIEAPPLYPQMRVRHLVQRSPQDTITLIGSYVDVMARDAAAGGVLQPSDMADLRFAAGLAPMPVATATEERTGCGPGHRHERSAQIDAAGMTIHVRRPLRELEALADLRSISDTMDGAADRLVRKLGDVGVEQRTAFIDLVTPLLAAGDPGAVASMAATSFAGRYASAIRDELIAVRSDAGRQMLREIARQVGQVASVPQGVEITEATIRATAAAIGRQLSDDLDARLRNAALQVLRGAPLETLTGAVTTPDRGAMVEPVTLAVALGREEVAAGGPEIVEVEYSAVLDSDTCSECAASDGVVVVYGSPEYTRLTPPNVACKSNLSRRNGNRCRCLWFYRFGT